MKCKEIVEAKEELKKIMRDRRCWGGVYDEGYYMGLVRANEVVEAYCRDGDCE